MMFFDERRAQAIEAAARPVDAILNSAPEPGLFSGTDIPGSIVRGEAQFEGMLASGLATATQPYWDAQERLTGIKPLNLFSAWRDMADSEAAKYAPDPLTTGAAAQAINGITGALTQTTAGVLATLASGGAAADVMAAGATTMGASQGRQTYLDLRKEGVDPTTAVNAGFINAVTSGAAAMLPMGVGYSQLASGLSRAGLLTAMQLPKSAYLAANIALGGAANAGIGIVQRGATADVLRAGGYDTMAHLYEPMDNAALGADFLLGGIFSGAGALAGLPWRAGPAVDAAMLARDARHAKLGTAPGVPADPSAADAHARALDQAVRDVWDGQQVDVSQTGVEDAAFMPHPERDTSAREAARTEYAAGPALPAPDDVALQRLPEAQRQPMADLYAKAAEEKPGFDATLMDIAKQTGSETQLAGLKTIGRAVDKTLSDYGGDASQLKDVLRGTIVANSLEDARAAIAQIKQRFQMPEGGQRDLLSAEAEPGQDGYRDAKLNVVVNGHTAEVQVNLPEMLAAKKKAHPLYVEAQKLKREAAARNEAMPPRAVELMAQQRAIYDAAWAEVQTRATNSRKADSEMGAPLRSADSNGKGRGAGGSQQMPKEGGTPAPTVTGIPSTSKNSQPGANLAGSRSEGDSGFIGKTSDSSIRQTAADDLETRAGLALLDERGDMVLPMVDENGNEVQHSLRQALDQADAELGHATPEAFAAAVACQLKNGGA